MNDNSHPYQPRINIRGECNYGVLNWLELGGYIGYIRYYNSYHNQKRYAKGNTNAFWPAFAPAFGINANVHLLPFWVKNKDNRWELYVTAKYGGAYLINHFEFWRVGVKVSSSNPNISQMRDSCSGERYRHEFGIGIGGGVYFKNLIGLYAEALVGQYSHFQEIFSCYWTARIGIEFKFRHEKKIKTRKNKNGEILPQHIEIQI
jgi:hypothetical protein